MRKKTTAEGQKSIATRVSHRLSQMGSPFSDCLVVLRGQGMATVYGCRKILLYTSPEIRLCMKKKQICIFGSELVCTSFSGGTVTVEGQIEGIRYIKGAEALQKQ